MTQFIDSNLCCPDVVSYEVLDIEDGLQSFDSWPMGVRSTVGIESSASLVANLTLKGTSAFPGEQTAYVADLLCFPSANTF
ncbi:hypothetical protein T02_8553 [Trichinella nativa]|uniref:Uncharacterized protein n=1 Tax=Trichinella nativa TaxID=6335 RepID=A0A0V1KL15_9BILA|nr:hypothetical protein T02_8553 [Trichinella nativa]